jgi:imidazolonepropionase-like amidohydrolase
MARAGVLVSLNSDSDELIRRLNHEAAKAARYGGAAEDEALKMVTLNPAKQLRAEHRLGSIEAGKDADLAIFDAHPLSIYARCLYTVIEGEVYFERKAPRGNPQAGRPLPASRDFLPAEPPRHPGGLYAIRDARVVPVASAPIDRGTVVIAAGRIAAVGPSAEVAVPAGAAVIDGQGLSVYPGLIDAGSTLGLVEIESVAGSVDLDETGSAQPDLRVAVAVNAHSELIPSTRASGITAAAVFGRGGLIGGQAGVIRLAGTSTPEATLRDRFALQVNLPRVGRDDKDDPPAVKELKDWFARARRYASAANGRDQRLEALLPFAKKELPVVFAADSEAQLRLAIRLAADLDVRAVVRGARDAWKVASLLKEKGIAAIVGPVLALPIEAFDPYDAPYRNASRLHEAGVPFAFQSGDDASFSRNLPFNAGTAVAFGLPHDAAVRALTLGAAEILGIAERRGSIAAGKAADLIVVDGDPLETLTLVHYVFIDGQPQSLETRQTRFYRQFRDRLTARGRGNERGF